MVSISARTYWIGCGSITLVATLVYCSGSLGIVLYLVFMNQSARMQAANGESENSNSRTSATTSSELKKTDDKSSILLPSKVTESETQLANECEDILKLVEDHQIGLALRKVDSLIDKTPNNPRLFVLRGIIQTVQSSTSRKGSNEQVQLANMAIADFDKALELDSGIVKKSATKTMNVYLLRAKLYLIMEDWSSVILEADKAIVIDPDLAESYTTRGIAYITLGAQDLDKPYFPYWKKGVADLKKAAELDSKHKPLYEKSESNYKKLLLLTGQIEP